MPSRVDRLADLERRNASRTKPGAQAAFNALVSTLNAIASRAAMRALTDDDRATLTFMRERHADAR